MKKILIISASGMGCTVMFTPTLRLLRKRFPKARITFLGTSKSFVAPLEGSDFVDEVLVFDFAKGSLTDFKKLNRRLQFIKKLRREHFDISVTVFPSNKWYFNMFAWLVGAKQRITHHYSTPTWKNLSWLQNTKVEADPKLHDVEQNMNLLRPLGVKPADKPSLYFHISQEDQVQADKILAELDDSKLIVGMHIGSSQDFAFAAKRWPTEKFAQLADRLHEELGAQMVVFAGPEENNDMEILQKIMKTKPRIVQAPIKVTAALIDKCDLMISNDSGLMHIAVAMKTPVVAIFGPTSVSRTRPYTANAVTVYDHNHHSLLEYPFTTTSAKLDSIESRKCFETITTEKVFDVVKSKLNG
ncbi:glycosyltransferase family 9 protein [Patescibacteria group bacterium]